MKKPNQQSGLYCLNKGWRFIEKEYSVLPDTRCHDDIYGYSKGGAQRGPAASGFDDSDWEKIELPHDWVTTHEPYKEGSPNMGYKDRGIGWYRIRFGLSEEDRNKQILLEFEGMSCDAQIYVNGMLLKRNYSGYNSFVVNMTDMAHFGSIPNTLAIRIDASAWEGWWYEGAGIYRNVWLLKKAPVHLKYQGIFLCPEKTDAGGWNLKIQTELENSFEFSKEVSVKHTLYNQQHQVIGEVSDEIDVCGFGEQVLQQNILVEAPALWSPESPTLYEVRSSVYYEHTEQDYQVQNIGFRSIEWNAETGFWLNGESMKLKGFCNHQDHAGVGVAVPENLKEFRMLRLKELGANAFRCAHNPDPEILGICDRIGMLVMEENRTFSSEDSNLMEIQGIVRNARNHPSVILYSVLNEEPLQGTPKGRRIAGRLQAAVKEMDPTRYVLGAFNGGYLEEEGAATILDGVGINYNPARYDEFHAKFPQIPLLGSETASAFMVRGEYETNLEKHLIDDYDSEAALWGNGVREAWDYVVKRPFVAGGFVWTGFDYRGEPTPFEWPSVATFFGTYDSCGFEKDACYLYKAFWKKEPMVHLVSPWGDKSQIGKEIKVQVYTNADHIQLFVNGELVEEQDTDPIWQSSFTLTQVQGELKAVAFIQGKEGARDVQMTTLEPKAVKLVNDTTRAVKTGGFDCIIVHAEIVDENGNIAVNAEDQITFSVKNGRIIGVGNGNPNSHEADVADYRKAFHGLAQVLIKPEGSAPVEVLASALNLEADSITVDVESGEEIPYVETLEEAIVEGWRLFHTISLERPDEQIITKKNDMNTFEPVNIAGHPLSELSGKLNHYAMYRTFYDIGEGGGRFYFCAVEGHVWIYLNKTLVKERTDSYNGEILLELPEHLSGEIEMMIVVKAANPEYAEAGIVSPVFYQK